MKTGWCLFALMYSLTCLGADVAVVQREATVNTLPSKGSKVVETLAARSKVTVLKRAGLWFQEQPIDSQAFKGWVRFSRLRMTGSTENAATQAQSSGTISNPARSARGPFGLFRTESELAGVLAHEMGHVLERHHLVAIQKIAQRGLATDVLSELAASQSQSLWANKQLFSALV